MGFWGALGVLAEWALAPLTACALVAASFLLIGAGWREAGRELRRLAVIALVTQYLLLLADDALGTKARAWTGFFGHRLLLEVAGWALAAGLALVRRDEIWARLGDRGEPSRQAMRSGTIGSAVVALAMLVPWLVPSTLRSSLSLAREMARGEGPYWMGLFATTLLGARDDAHLRLVARGADGVVAAAYVLRHEVAGDGSPSQQGASAVMNVLASSRSSAAIDELKRWTERQDASPAMRSAALTSLSRAGDATFSRSAGDVVRKAPATYAGRQEQAAAVRVCLAHGDGAVDIECEAAMRTMLRQRVGPNDDGVAEAYAHLLKSDAPENRAAVLEFFMDGERFKALIQMGQPLYVKQVAEAIRPLVSDLLDDEGEDERTRACAYLISNDSAGKQQWPALYEQAGPAPCDRIVDDDHAFVAAAIRTALGLPAPRPPLPASARLAPWVDTEREARALCHADRFEGHCGTVSHIIISQDGARAVTSGSVGGPDLWDVAGRRRIRSLTSASDQSPLGFVAETGNIVTQLPFGGLFVFEPRHGRFLLKTEYCESSTQAGKTGGGAYRVRTAGVAALSADGSVGATTGSATCIWDTRDGRQVARFDPCGSGADGTPPPEPEPAPLPGGAMMPYGYPPPYQRQMLLQSQMQLRARLVQRPVAYPSAVALSVDGSTLAVGCVQHIRWFDSKTGAPLGQVAIGEGSAVGRLLVLGHRADLRIVSAEVPLEGANSPAEVRVWSAARRRIESTIPIGPAGQNLGFVMHGTKDWGRASLLAASPDGSRILLVANPRTCVWDLAGGERIHCLTSPENAPIAAVAWSPEGSFVMGADQEVSGYTPDAGPSRRGLQVWPASELVKSP